MKLINMDLKIPHQIKVSNSQINKGEIDWINEKALSKTILDAIKNLEKNEISNQL